jgi:hypothetical protein
MASNLFKDALRVHDRFSGSNETLPSSLVPYLVKSCCRIHDFNHFFTCQLQCKLFQFLSAIFSLSATGTCVQSEGASLEKTYTAVKIIVAPMENLVVSGVSNCRP